VRWVAVGTRLGADEGRNPFNDRIIASGSDDGKVFVWQVPQGFTLYSDAEEPVDVAPISKLSGHSRYVTRSPKRTTL
jgi:coronin-1B/1C/6